MIGCLKNMLGMFKRKPLKSSEPTCEQKLRWRIAVCCDPDTRYAERLAKKLVPSITMADVERLADAFEQDVMAGIEASKNYFCNLLNIEQVPKLFTYEEWIALHPQDAEALIEWPIMTCHFELNKTGEFSYMGLLVNPAQFHGYSKSELLLRTGHEAMHSFQIQTIASALKKGMPMAVDVTKKPKKAQRAELYLFNHKHPINPEINGYEACRQQLLEIEAFIFEGRIRSWVQDLIRENHAEDVAAKLNCIL